MVVLAAVGFARGAVSEPVVASSLTASARPVQVAEPEWVDGYEACRGFTGRVEARRRADLGFQLGGELSEVAVHDGESVAQGQVLARLDTRRLDVRQAQVEASLARARAQLEEMQAGPRVQTIAASRARVKELDEQLALLKKKQERRTALRASAVISQEQLDEADANMLAQIARLESARRNLDLLLAGTRAEQLRAQRAAVRQLEAELESIAVDRNDSELSAPFAGVVARVRSDEGTVVSAGQPILRVVEVGELEAWVGVAPRSAAQLKVGDEQRLRTRTHDVPARLRAILPELDPSTRTVTAIFSVVDSAASGLVPEQVVHVELKERVATPGAWIPLTALDRGERDLWSVFVIADQDGGSVVERRDVEVLHQDTDRVFVRGGLAAGDRIVATGVHRLVAGERVAPRAAE